MCQVNIMLDNNPPHIMERPTIICIIPILTWLQKAHGMVYTNLGHAKVKTKAH